MDGLTVSSKSLQWSGWGAPIAVWTNKVGTSYREVGPHVSPPRVGKNGWKGGRWSPRKDRRETMNFAEAFAQILQGKAVKRSTWDNISIAMLHGSTLILMRGPYLLKQDWLPSNDELFVTDWEVVDVPMFGSGPAGVHNGDVRDNQAKP